MAEVKKIQKVDIFKLKPYERNAKIHTEEQLEKLSKSIEEFGFISPVLIDKDFNIIAGHGRVEAAKRSGVKEVPCAIIEGLTEAQQRAYILADNRLSEFSKWDKDMLAYELGEIAELDLDFDIDDFDFPELELDSNEGYYGDERERTNKAYNLDIAQEVEDKSDFWQMPIIKCDNFIPDNIIGFNYAKTSKNKNVGVHLFVDDYQFERLWTAPEKYVDILKEYECIFSPDFSLYNDMPMPMKIWNVYRSRMLGAYYQSKGIKVIPTISWSEEATFEFCFCGIPKGSIVAISTIGVKDNERNFNIWKNGVDAMIEAIEPSMILIYGGSVEYDYKIPVKYYDNEVLKRWKGKKNDT